MTLADALTVSNPPGQLDSPEGEASVAPTAPGVKAGYTASHMQWRSVGPYAEGAALIAAVRSTTFTGADLR